MSFLWLWQTSTVHWISDYISVLWSILRTWEKRSRHVARTICCLQSQPLVTFRDPNLYGLSFVPCSQVLKGSTGPTGLAFIVTYDEYDWNINKTNQDNLLQVLLLSSWGFIAYFDTSITKLYSSLDNRAVVVGLLQVSLYKYHFTWDKIRAGKGGKSWHL